MNVQCTVSVIVAVALCACSRAESQKPTAPVPSAASSGKSAPSTSAVTITGDRIRGKVVETMDTSGYTYVAVEVGPGQRVWAAGPQTAMKVGDMLDVPKGSQMKGFKSKTLNRTFDSIYFVSSFSGQAATQPSSQPTAAASQPVKGPTGKAILVKKAAGGQTVAEIFSSAKTLSGQPILIRGQVVKYNAGIMGKNWLHIQDGTGDINLKTHDLTVTTNGTAKVGQTVLIKGTLTTNKDFGAGYSYPVIVEDASVTVQ
ncbi:MAG: DNA-binding protein [Myxococcota bacterium]|nr:DNA-binding protein [Myxococcota bacterium]